MNTVPQIMYPLIVIAAVCALVVFLAGRAKAKQKTQHVARKTGQQGNLK